MWHVDRKKVVFGDFRQTMRCQLLANLLIIICPDQPESHSRCVPSDVKDGYISFFLSTFKFKNMVQTEVITYQSHVDNGSIWPDSSRAVVCCQFEHIHWDDILETRVASLKIYECHRVGEQICHQHFGEPIL